jgi:hypothetical protein
MGGGAGLRALDGIVVKKTKNKKDNRWPSVPCQSSTLAGDTLGHLWRNESAAALQNFRQRSPRPMYGYVWNAVPVSDMH